MKALILYFSGTGNTMYVAKIIGEELNKLGVETELHSTEENFAICANTYDLLILGCPKYYECPTLDFIKYIKKYLPVSAKAIPTLMFITQAGPLATDSESITQLLARKNHRLVVSKSFAFSNNMMIFSFFKATGDAKIKENIAQIRSEAASLLRGFLNGDINNESIGAFKSFFEWLVAVIFTKLMPVFGMKYSVSDACTGCGLCAKKCPKGNITMLEKRPHFGRKCIFCMRCINGCPANAILYNKKKCLQYHAPTFKPAP